MIEQIRELQQKHNICNHSFYQTNWIDRKKNEFIMECGCGKTKTKEEWLDYVKELEKIYHNN